jgi:branched-chain amino acid transport system ATP-binding protein
LLKIESIFVNYGKANVLKGINFEINKGEFVSIVGSNGAGKTTTIKTIVGLLFPISGAIHFEGENITNLPAWKRSALGISYVPEGRRIFPELTVEENLLMGGYGSNKVVVKKSLQKVYDIFPRLYERRKQHGKTLSGGEQQMLAIGRAVIPEPKLILIDEMSIGLMPIMIQKAFDVVEALHQTGITVLMVEQNVHKAIDYSEKLYVLRNGEIVFQEQTTNIEDYNKIVEVYMGEVAI